MSEELVQAAFNGNVAEVTRLLREGADINFRGCNWTPLHAAIENERLDCVRTLVSAGADVSLVVYGLTPLAHAVDIAIDGTIQTGGKQGDEPLEKVNILLAAGADPKPGMDVARNYGNARLMAIFACDSRSQYSSR